MEHRHRYYERKMEKFVTSGFKIFFVIIIFTILVLIAGYVFMRLWNWLMPDLFGLITINYWQALGLMLLAKFLFGFGNHSSKSSRKKHRRERKLERFCKSEKSLSEWKHYDQFWKEEGEQAFNNYVERMKNEEGNDSEQKA